MTTTPLPCESPVFGRVYYNSRSKRFSVRVGGRVTFKATDILIRDVTPVVSAASIARIRREGKKYVCAFLEGDCVALQEGTRKMGGKPLSFNPYINEGFVFGDGKPYRGGEWVALRIGPFGPILFAGGKVKLAPKRQKPTLKKRPSERAVAGGDRP